MTTDKFQQLLWKWFRGALMLLGAIELVRMLAAVAVHFLGGH